MKASKFELFMCCLGNGTTVCNKAVEEYGDYKKVAHIGNNGKITWYVSEDYIPEAELFKIKAVAEQDRKKYLSWWNNLSTAEKYSRLLDMLPHKAFMEVVVGKESTMAQKVERLEKEYI